MAPARRAPDGKLDSGEGVRKRTRHEKLLNLKSGVAHGDPRQSVGLQRLARTARCANRRTFGFAQAFSLQHLNPSHPRSTADFRLN